MTLRDAAEAPTPSRGAALADALIDYALDVLADALFALAARLRDRARHVEKGHHETSHH